MNVQNKKYGSLVLELTETSKIIWFPTLIVQTDRKIDFLDEKNNWFLIVVFFFCRRKCEL